MLMMAKTATTRKAAAAISPPMAETVLVASTGRTRDVMSVVLPAADAVRTLGLLAGGVGADRRALDDLAGVHADVAAALGDREAVEAARRRAALLLAVAVVLRTVALA